MLRIAICDDEQLHRQLLVDAITVFSIQNDMEFLITQMGLASELLSNPCEFDIIFLDIRLDHGINGIEVGRKIRESGYASVIVIVTSMEQYSLDGYAIEAFRYILKPFNQKSVDETLKAILRKYNKDESKVEVKCLSGTFFFDVDDIIMIESYNRMRKIYLLNADVIETRETFLVLHHKLPNKQFAFAQKSFLVNFKHLMSECRNVITMRNGYKITISRNRIKGFIEAFQTYIKNLGRDD
ncbi:MAG: LytTR family DNA-binding domain-containing protein [Anaerovoracaceae bacterium]